MGVLKHQELAEGLYTSDDWKDVLVYHREYDLFYVYENGYYKKLEEFDFQRIVWDFARFNYPDKNITTNIVNDAIRQIKWGCLGQAHSDDTGYVAFKDKLLNLITFKTEPHDKKKIVTFYLPFNYDELGIETPDFDRFLATTFVNNKKEKKTDEDLIELVQEMCGSFLIDNMKASKAFFLVGTGANGKSILLDVIRKIFGSEFTCAMSIQSLTTQNFSVQHLVGKKINLVNEEESKYIGSARFKALVSGDLISADRKFGTTIEFRPRAKHVFASNRLPTFDGINTGLSRKIMVIPFNNRFLENDEGRDVDMDEKLEKEMAGILLWAIRGAQRLVKNNYKFSDSKSSAKAKFSYESDMSSSLRFIRENYQVDTASFTASIDLYRDYKDWCAESGKKPVNKFGFIKEITENMDGVETKRGYANSMQCRGLNIMKVDKEGLAASFGGEPQDINIDKLNF